MGIPAFQYMNLSSGVTTTGGAIGPLTADRCTGFSATVNTTGTLTGTFKFYLSNDPRARQDRSSADRAAAVWTEFTTDVSSMITNPSGGTTSFTVNVSDFRAEYLRVDYTHTSGSGTVQIYVTCE